MNDFLTLLGDQASGQTGTPLSLTDIQKAILAGVMQDQTYSEIADEVFLNKQHIRNEGSKLWQILSKAIGKKVTKKTAKGMLEKIVIQQNNSSIALSPTVGERVTVNNSFHICPKTEQKKPSTTQKKPNLTPKIDLTTAPNISTHINRSSELAQLQQAISHPNTRIITIFGVGGMGKTALTLQLIPHIQSQFDYIIYRSLKTAPTLTSLQSDLIEFINSETPSASILDICKNDRTLLILDDLHYLFSPGKLASQYLPKYQDYSKFFQQIATLSHQSRLMLLTWEKPKEIIYYEDENQLCYSLYLKGLGTSASEILKQKGLRDEDKWSQFIDLYQGHPLWLNIIANMIQDLFNGSVAQFLSLNTLFLDEIEPLLNEHLDRLSEGEKNVLSWLANQDNSVDICQLPTTLSLSKDEFLSAIQSLRRRSLLEKNQDCFLTIPPVIKSFITSLSPRSLLQ